LTTSIKGIQKIEITSKSLFNAVWLFPFPHKGKSVASPTFKAILVTIFTINGALAVSYDQSVNHLIKIIISI